MQHDAVQKPLELAHAVCHKTLLESPLDLFLGQGRDDHKRVLLCQAVVQPRKVFVTSTHDLAVQLCKFFFWGGGGSSSIKYHCLRTLVLTEYAMNVVTPENFLRFSGLVTKVVKICLVGVHRPSV